MSRSDRLLVSLARAFIYNPEVLVVRGLEGSAEGGEERARGQRESQQSISLTLFFQGSKDEKDI